MSKKKLISKLSLSEEQIEEIKKKHSIDVVEELENILMEELKKIGATTDSPAFKNARKLIKDDKI
jgi:Ca2+-binding EF-hand superfamily protein